MNSLKNLKSIKVSFFVFICFFIFLNRLYALGVSPAVIDLDFEPDTTKSFEYMVINYPERDQDVEVYVSLSQISEDIREEFENVLTLDKTKISFKKNIPSEKVKVLVQFPKGFSRAGIYELRVGAKPYVSGGEGISAIAGNEVIVRINVPEKYASSQYAIPKKISVISVSAKPVKKGEKAEVEVQVKSKTDKILEKVFARVRIIHNGNDISGLESKAEDIFPGETKTFTVIFPTSNFPVGTLNINAEVVYGNEKSERGTGTLTILEGDKGLFSLKSNKNFKINGYVVIIVFLVVVVLILAYLLFRGKLRGIGGSYDFSSESGGY